MFGELVCGPPGSGKTTYCEGKRQFLSVYDPARPVTMLNMDPANEGVFPYPCDVDIRDLVCQETVMEKEMLGPNGSYLFCAQFIEQHMDWVISNLEQALERRVEEVLAAGGGNGLRAPYLIIDCPGQVEFYVNSRLLHTLIKSLQKRLQCSLCTVHLVDAVIATRDIPTYASACILALTTMIDHELPHLNLLTKWDTLPPEDIDEHHPFLAASNFLAEDFDRLWKKELRRKQHNRRLADQCLSAEAVKKQGPMTDSAADAAIENIDLEKDGGRVYKYTKTLMNVVEGYGVLGFLPLNVQSQEMMLRVTREMDNAVGNFV